MKSYEEVKNILSVIEPDESIYTRLTNEDIPNIEKILHEKESWLASRGVFALSRMPTEQSQKILLKLTTDPRVEVRVSLASCTNTLPINISDELLNKLVADPEAGVRKFAYQSVRSQNTPVLINRLKQLSTQENNSFLKDILNKKMLEINR